MAFILELSRALVSDMGTCGCTYGIHWGFMVFIFELTEAPVAGTGTSWDTSVQPWDILGPINSVLGTCCAPSTGTTSPC